ncbi:tyrosinase family protein [Sphingomonas sp. SUN039]|uniref:tyrosinase family protein n=1 Tax=Sphingomonas sp. SUN039 TaxID=2937787 RepID=UPI0021641937|nr:tyrosinase family protein [Sphingomonas sp. SUN039]UVO52954.1 tyrosinase family protein [Sphingomonas sp. SUN039]
MTFTRQNIYGLGSTWAPAVLWYARGVKAMKARAIADPNSWSFYGAIHGIYPPLWTKYGYLSPTMPKPKPADVKRYWDQCQHGSWYFLPWHRGYLLAFEANVRAEIVKLGGPATWALPYWNYFAPNQFKLPPAFATQSWPDGATDNPLFVKQRYGPNNNGNVFVPVNMVNLNALGDPDFTGVSSGSPGFGGLDTGFSHGGPTHGGIETQPHDYVHGLVGGANPAAPNTQPGLMSDPDTAALDPIFWLHHANIDRLWAAWRKAGHTDPTDPDWLKGPGNTGGRIFSMPMPGAVAWDYTPQQMVSLATLGYQYDSLTPAVAPVSPVQPMVRLEALGAGTAALAGAGGLDDMASGKNVELVGASPKPVAIVGSDITTAVALDPATRRKVADNLTESAALSDGASLDRVFLNLENVRGAADATAFSVYVDLPEGTDPALHPERLAGSIALFGVRKASLADDEHGGAGLNYSLEITQIVDALHLEDKLDVDTLGIRFVPTNPVSKSAKISIGRISIYRQGL